MSISTKISVMGLILGLTLAYSLYYKHQYKQFFESGGGLVLKTLPDFSLKVPSSEKRVVPDDLFADGKKFAMVHFWATWCAPCEAELPEFIKLAKKFDQIGFALIAVNDDEKKIDKFFKRFGELPSNIYLAHDEEGTVSARFGTIKLPETYLFARKSRRHVNKYIGPQEWGKKSVEVRLKFYLESVEKLDSSEESEGTAYRDRMEKNSAGALAESTREDSTQISGN